MAVVQNSDYKEAALKGLSGVNFAVVNSALSDTIINANATVTLLMAAINATALVAGDSQDALRQCANSLRLAQLTGIVPETTNVTTVAGLRALFTANLPDVAGTYTGGGLAS